ncbi:MULTISPECIES: hypothetical protein [Protofrankia]|uniref:hypothetical protein n=1 Tax=Frankiaceae TaxID=74712 RepID=UPI000AB05276|nr:MULTISPECIES: hypothetical protein [Protofrankia]
MTAGLPAAGLFPRHATDIAELVPLRRRTFVPAAQVLAMFAHEAPLDSDRFFADLDGVVDQGLLGE